MIEQEVIIEIEIEIKIEVEVEVEVLLEINMIHIHNIINNMVSCEHHSYFVKIYKHDTYDISLNK